jgi:hypothetical protein
MKEMKRLKDDDEIERLQKVNIELNKINLDLARNLGIS